LNKIIHITKEQTQWNNVSILIINVTQPRSLFRTTILSKITSLSVLCITDFENRSCIVYVVWFSMGLCMFIFQEMRFSSLTIVAHTVEADITVRKINSDLTRAGEIRRTNSWAITENRAWDGQWYLYRFSSKSGNQ